jgi:hypothetical protein
MNRFVVYACSFGVFVASGPARAEIKFDCGKPENLEIAQTLKPVIEKAKLCKGLKDKVDAGLFKIRIKVDQTKLVRVESIDYCTSSDSRRIAATVAVECATDDNEDVHITLAETFNVAVEIGNKDCAVTAFRIEPQGKIGKLIARNIDFEHKVRKAIQRQIAKACNGAS